MLGFKTIEEFTLEECIAFLERTDISEEDRQSAEARKQYLLNLPPLPEPELEPSSEGAVVTDKKSHKTRRQEVELPEIEWGYKAWKCRQDQPQNVFNTHPECKFLPLNPKELSSMWREKLFFALIFLLWRLDWCRMVESKIVVV